MPELERLVKVCASLNKSQLEWWQWLCFKTREYCNQIILWGKKNDSRGLAGNLIERVGAFAKLQESESRPLSQGGSLGSGVA